MVQRQVTAFGPPGHFYECPRWRDGRWWVSDMRGGAVYSFSPEGEARTELKIDDRPGGLGWTRDGKLLVISMEAKALLQVSPDGKVEKTLELTHLAGGITGFLNDMAVSRSGHAYIGFDADFHAYPADANLGKILHVTPDGAAAVVAEGLAFPNGLVFSPDEATLVAAETMQPRFTAFSISADGTLGPGRPWGLLGPDRDARAHREPPLGERTTMLDGCAVMDAEGCIWAADVNSTCLRIAPGGKVVDAVFLPDGLRVFACALGGVDGRTLVICGADDNFQDRTSRRAAQLFTTQVDVAVA